MMKNTDFDAGSHQYRPYVVACTAKCGISTDTTKVQSCPQSLMCHADCVIRVGKTLRKNPALAARWATLPDSGYRWVQQLAEEKALSKARVDQVHKSHWSTDKVMPAY